MILKVAGKSPPWLANFLRAFAPFVTLTFTILNIIGPVVIKFYALLYKVSAKRGRQFICLLFCVKRCLVVVGASCVGFFLLP